MPARQMTGFASRLDDQGSTAFVRPSGVLMPTPPPPRPVPAHETATQRDARIAADNEDMLNYRAALATWEENETMREESAAREREQVRADQEFNAILAQAGTAFSSIATMVNGAIRSGSAERIETARLESAARIAALQGGAPSANQAQEMAVLQAAIASLAARQAPPPDNKMPLYIGLGVAALAAVGGMMWFVTRRTSRNNPYETRANVIVKGKNGKKRFMSAAALRRAKARRRNA